MAITSLDMTPAKFSATNPSMNKRWPPLADKTALPYRLTSLSRQKLAREATAPNPDIRRCLGHFRLHCSSMEWAQKEMTTRINSFELEDDDEDEEEECEKEEQKQQKQLPLLGPHDEEEKNKIKGRKDDEDEEGSGKKELHVQFHIAVTPSEPKPKSPSPSQSSPSPSSPSSQSTSSSSPTSSNAPSDESERDKEKDSLLEKGISRLEKTVQRRHFWPTPGQCMPVRISG